MSGTCQCGCGRSAGPSGWAKPCLNRWYRDGRPEGGPRPPVPLSQANVSWRDELHADREMRIAAFARERAMGATIARAALWAGVGWRTGKEYAAELRRRQRERTAA